VHARIGTACDVRYSSKPSQFLPMSRRAKWRTVIAVLVGCLLVSYLLFIDRADRKSCQAYVALDGKGPPGLAGPPWNAPDAVLLYRNGRNGVVCFDAFKSKELHDRLLPKNGQPVAVEYDTASDFGKVRGYNVHSVDGMVLANGYHVLKPEFTGSAGVLGNSSSTQDCW
jgi:hypothetical protein